MRKSIKVKFTAAYVGTLCLAFLAILFLNSCFLEDYYLAQKTDSLEYVHERLDKASKVNDNANYTSLEKDYDFHNYCLEKNISVIVIDRDKSQAVYSNGRDPKSMYAQALFGTMTEFMQGTHEIIRQEKNYILEKSEDNGRLTDSLNMVGSLKNENYFMITTPIQSMKDSAQISNLFYLYVGIATILVSSAVIWIISKKITRPLQELTELSKKMAGLDFEAKYTRAGEDEIGILGANLNIMSDELEETISELKTANNELQKDIEKKIQIDEMRKEFLSNVSHELKTPIALIQGYAEGLQECINDDAESREFYCDVIIDEAAKMNNMVKKLLTLNQLEFGNDQVSMERFDLTELIKGVLASTSLMADQKGAQIQFVQTEPVYVWGDEFKVEEVVTNYVSNALNHVDYEKKIEVKIQKRQELVRVSVFNTGDPIPEEDLDKIWIKFYKVDKARTREYGGSGIGLSIVKAIMESMNQKCGVVNYENGVEFWFELQCGNGQPPRLPKQQEAA